MTDKIDGLEVYKSEKGTSKLAGEIKDKLKKKDSFLNKMINIIAPPKTQEQIEYEQDLKKITTEARHTAFMQESVKQEVQKGREMAQKKYAKKDGFGGNMPEGVNKLLYGESNKQPSKSNKQIWDEIS